MQQCKLTIFQFLKWLRENTFLIEKNRRKSLKENNACNERSRFNKINNFWKKKMGDIGLKARGQTEKKLLSEALRIFIHGWVVAKLLVISLPMITQQLDSIPKEDALEKEMTTHSSILGNLMDKGAWFATVHGVAKSRTWLSQMTTGQEILEIQ